MCMKMYEVQLSGFNSRARVEDEHRYILSKLYGDATQTNKRIVYKKYGSLLVIRTVHKPTTDIRFNEVEYNFQVGSTIMISFIGNPRYPSGKPIVDHSELVKWLELHGINRYGFNIINCGVKVDSPFKMESYVLHRATFVAIVEITDPDKFIDGFVNGIGKEACHGFGMITLQ